MQTMQGRLWLVLGGLLAALSVALGAYQSHGLASYLAPFHLPAEVLEERLHMFDVGVRYQMYHALGLVAVGTLCLHHRSRLLTLSGLAFLVGTLLFSGSLYCIGLTGHDAIGRVAPIGGSTLIGGWVAFAFAAPLLRARDDD